MHRILDVVAWTILGSVLLVSAVVLIIMVGSILLAAWPLVVFALAIGLVVGAAIWVGIL